MGDHDQILQYNTSTAKFCVYDKSAIYRIFRNTERHACLNLGFCRSAGDDETIPSKLCAECYDGGSNFNLERVFNRLVDIKTVRYASWFTIHSLQHD